MAHPTLVARTPAGWCALCMTCCGSDGGALDLGEWTLKREADDAARDHRVAEHPTEQRCPTCGHLT